MAALIHFFPALGKHGNRKPPRSWRALRGWRHLDSDPRGESHMERGRIRLVLPRLLADGAPDCMDG
eukprot:7666061-Pyramimonas_sp.AAC.1